MNIVSRIRFPIAADVSDLYMRCYEGASINYGEDWKKVTLLQRSSVCLSTYFNSFYEQFYAKYTELHALYYLLKLEGDFQISMYREFQGREDRELIFRQDFQNCQLSDYVKVLIPDLSQTEVLGRVYLEILCLSECGLFTEGAIATEQSQKREVSIGIISCTFKKEDYIKKTVATILNDKNISSKEIKLFIVDNGKSLSKSDFLDGRVELIPNRNVGGSGGFTRGLIEAMQEENHTHFLFMDDDIELDSESIYRLFSLYEYAKSDFAIAGSMLDLYKKNILYEAGASYGKRPENNENHPFSVTLRKSNLDLQKPSSLNLLLIEESLDYGGFWFFSFSRQVVEKIGLLMPFFIKIDDMEFGLRVKECSSNSIVSFPSIAVWHEPFYAKDPVWDSYYSYRNHLITHSIHKPLRYGDAIKYLTKRLILCLLIYDYNSAELIIKALEDYMKGPSLLKNNKPEFLHSDILKISKMHKIQIVKNDCFNKQLAQNFTAGNLSKILSLITLNGHFLPNFLLNNHDVLIWHNSDSSFKEQCYKAFNKKRVVILKEKNVVCRQTEINKLAGIKLLFRWFRVATKSSIKWLYISTEWKNTASDLSSTEFWQVHLGIEKQS